MNKPIVDTINPARVRYIKLGKGGGWENECLEKGIIRIGFGSDKKMDLCISKRWDDVRESYINAGEDASTATRFTNELRIFFEDIGSILWITFIGERFCWGFVDSVEPKLHADGRGVYRLIRKGWCWTDIHGEQLTKDKLSGGLIKLASYRGTSCDVDVADYVIRRINGQKIDDVERAIAASKVLESSILGLMQLLNPRDFEILVDLVFSASGWRRLGIVGGTEKTRDLDLILPSTGHRAFVQVKSKTTTAELEEYITKIDDIYDYMFYVYHSGEAETSDERVIVINSERFAKMVFDAGLVNWLIQKVS